MYSFKYIGHTPENIHVFYSSPNAQSREDGFVPYIEETLAKRPGPWVWILNCNEMTPKQAGNLSLAMQIVKLLKKHTQDCRGVYVQNTNWAITKLLQAITATLPITLTCRLFVDKTPPTFSPVA